MLTRAELRAQREPRPPPIQRAIIIAVVTIPLLALFVAAWQLWDRAVGWTDVILLVGLYMPVGLGVTVGYHRMLTHRSFAAHPAVRLMLLILGSMSVEGAALGWAATHLKHHALTDKRGDPHSPLDGLFHSHLGWLVSNALADPRVWCRHLLQDPITVFVDRTFVLWVAVSLAVPFAIGGWEGLVWGGLVRMFVVHHVTWSVNSVCHTFGKRTYATVDRSSNHWLVGLLAMGEGWHNNHHAFPRSAIHGMDRWQFDGSAFVITALEKLHLVRDVYRIPADLRLRKREVRLAAGD